MALNTFFLGNFYLVPLIAKSKQTFKIATENRQKDVNLAVIQSKAVGPNSKVVVSQETLASSERIEKMSLGQIFGQSFVVNESESDLSQENEQITGNTKLHVDEESENSFFEEELDPLRQENEQITSNAKLKANEENNDSFFEEELELIRSPSRSCDEASNSRALILKEPSPPKRKSQTPKRNLKSKESAMRFKRGKIQPGLAGLSQRMNQSKQTKTGYSIPLAPFQRLVKEITYDMKENFRFQSTAIDALREASESMLVNVFEDANMCSLHAKRITLFPTDMKLAIRIGRHQALD